MWDFAQWNKNRKGKTLEEIYGVEKGKAMRKKMVERNWRPNPKKRIVLTCEICKKQFETIPFFKNKKRFCSRQCSGVSKRRYSERYFHLEARKVALKHKKLVCEICNERWNLDVHHKDGNWKNNSLENLRVLCKKCHGKTRWKQNPVCGRTLKQKRKYSKEYSVKYRINNPEKARDACRKYSVENREKCREACRKWYAKHRKVQIV